MAARKGLWMIIGAGLAVSLLLAGVVTYYASSSPDGLEKVAEDVGFLEDAEESAVGGSPLADYAVEGVGDERVSVGLAGVLGVLVTAVVAFGLFLWLGRRKPAPDSESASSSVGG